MEETSVGAALASEAYVRAALKAAGAARRT